MRKFRPILNQLTALLPIMLLIITACGEREDGVYKIDGYVFDYSTGAGAPNVPVAIMRVNGSGVGLYSGGGSTSLQTLTTAKTDQNGYYIAKYSGDGGLRVFVSANQLWRPEYNPAYWYEERELKPEDIPDKGTYRAGAFNLRPLTQIRLRYRNTTPVDDSDQFTLLKVQSSPSVPIPLLVSAYTSPPRQFYAERGAYITHGSVQQPVSVNNGILSYFSPRQVWLGRGVDVEQTFTVLEGERLWLLWEVRKNGTTRSEIKDLIGHPTTDFLIEY